MTQHLDARSLHALLQGRLSAAQERDLAEHLAEGDCDLCDAYLLALDEASEREMFAILRRCVEAGDLPARASQSVPSSGIRLPMLVPAAGLAFLAIIGLTLTLALVRLEGDEPDQRIKGTEAHQAIRVELALGRLQQTAKGAVHIERMPADAELPASGSLVFRVNTDRPCYLYLIRVDPAGSMEVLLPDPAELPYLHQGGAYTPKIGSSPAGLPLRKLSGRQVFAAACSEVPLELPSGLDELADLIRAGRAAPQERPVVSFDMMSVRIVAKGSEP